MEREIKFRQPIFKKDGSFSHWYYWGFFEDEAGGIRYDGPAVGGGITPQRAWETSQQYIGLIDRFKREVYEGDIVNIQSHPYTPSEYNKIVAWNEHNLAWNINPPHGEERYTVIGNVTENPELLPKLS